MIRDFLRSLLPDFWIMIQNFDSSWDKALNRLLDSYPFTDIEEYRAKLGTISVWIKNIPYASFTPEIPGRPEDVQASRKTIAKAWRLLKETPGYPLTSGKFEDIQ